MNESQELFDLLNAYAAEIGGSCDHAFGEITLEVDADRLLEVLKYLRDHARLKFEQLIDLAGIDYKELNRVEWETDQASSQGFGRGFEANTASRFTFDDMPEESYEGNRFAVVYHLLSVSLNHRLRVRAFCKDNHFPILPSVISVWASANWYEREAFDLFGILFEGHPDLRRLLTDYGFIGHPMRKDFPLVGHVEMRYDPVERRVIYEPVSIEPRVLVPKVVREDARYLNDQENGED